MVNFHQNMSLEGHPTTQIQVENVGDYTQFITHATITQVAQVTETGEVVAFVEQHVIDPNHQYDPQQENIDPQQQTQIQHIVLEQLPVVTGTQHDETTEQHTEPIKPPVGKGPFRCDVCEKIFPKWKQYQRHQKSHDEDKPFRCTHCSASFNMEENLKLHLATHVGPDGEPVCPECGKKFSRIASLKAHIMLHEKEENLMCTECGDEFSLQSQLDKHMQEHRQEQEGRRTYACRQCTQEFNKPSYLREHMKQHYKIKSSLAHRPYKRNVDRTNFHYKCQSCGKTFQKPSQLERHNRIHTGERPYKCTMCSKAFNQKGALHIHLTKHTGEKPYSCDFCPSTFAQKGNLRAHIQRVHTLPRESEEGPTFHCDECSCVFKKLGSLNAHISRAHTDSNNTQQEIDLSQDDDARTVNVVKHLLGLSESASVTIEPVESINQVSKMDTADNQATNHQINQNMNAGTSADILAQALENSGLTGTSGETTAGVATVTVAGKELPAIAPVPLSEIPSNINSVTPIPMTLSTMTVHDTATGEVKKHVIRKINGVRWHQCTYCTKEFKKPSDLVRHIRIHTHEKPYKCTQCFRAFAVKSTLTAHIKTHTGVKEYKCHVCDKMFSTQGSLKVHLRLHTGARPFDCPNCDKRFRTSAHRKSHIASHFKEGGIPDRRPRRTFRRASKPDTSLPDIPLQEPILITDTGLIQQPPRNSMLNQYLGEAGSVDRPYKCGYCQRGFKKSSHLKQHVRSHTGEKPYKCIQCLRSFVSSGVLKAHIRTHTGVKAHRCMICDSTFTTNGSLKRHMSTHSEVRPFMCPYCQKTFKTSVNCKKHMKTHRHELAIQALQEQGGNAGEVTEQVVAEETVTQPDSDLTQEVQAADLVLQQQDLQTTNIQQDLTQQNLIGQPQIQDLEQFQHTLNHQIFGQAPTLGQSLLGQNQQNFNQLNTQLTAFTPTQFGLQTQQIPNAIDINTIQTGFSQAVTSLTSNLPSTSMQNILPTSDMQIPEAQEPDPSEQDEPTMDDSSIMVTEDGKRAFKCDHCDKSFKKSSHLKQHIRSHTGEKPYKCNQCGRMFVSAGVLKSHIKTHTGVKEYHCHICNAMFTTNGSLTRHMSIHVNTRQYKCPYNDCNETFRTSALCKRHMRLHRDIQITDEQAAELSKNIDDEDLTLSEKILLESATEKDTVSEEPGKEEVRYGKHAHQCGTCSKSFKKPSDLVRHLRIHTGEKPFRCETCGRSFTVKSTLDSHLKTHETTEKKYKCHVCSSMFSTKGSLKVHMRLHTGAKPFKCPHCDQKFRTSGHRKSHIISHFRPEVVPKKRSKVTTYTREIEEDTQQTSLLTPVADVQNLLTTSQANVGQVINVDPALLQAQNVMPLSLTVQDNLGQFSESALAAHVLQGLEGIQLQLTGNLGQGIQITGLDPNIFSQTVQIDASLLQQIQNQGNVNITINPNVLTQGLQTADPNLVQNVQVQPVTVQDSINPNIVIQPMSTITVQQMDQPTLQHNSVSAMVDGAPNAFIVTADGSLAPDQQIQSVPHDITNVVQEDAEQPIVVTEGICNKAFKRASHLKEHSQVHMQGSTTKKNKSTPHRCPTCDKAFQKPSQLERHKHSGEKPHTCSYCDQSFTQKGNLKTHIKRAHHVEMVQSMNLPKTFVPPAGATISISTDGKCFCESLTFDLYGIKSAEIFCNTCTCETFEVYVKVPNIFRINSTFKFSFERNLYNSVIYHQLNNFFFLMYGSVKQCHLGIGDSDIVNCIHILIYLVSCYRNPFAYFQG
ncbi:hypothetical protein KUTeg_020030 [Tegillarca granosa]|uniref:C2H2-type domain-containing protein n=1 Tax=Tegillarca granosa TaxID=220873 RepID=A0ABQ9EE67_TEGGR|nr:hypothetical protein KUTeg_020030 [Tegillarca granosa]